MKNNKLTIIIITILVLTIIGQLIYFKISKNNASNSVNQNETKIEIGELDIYRINNLLNEYKGELSESEIKGLLQTFVVDGIARIQQYTSYKTASKIGEYYDSNSQYYNKIGIDSKEDFLLIAEQINNIVRNDDTVLQDIRVNTLANPNDKIGYYKFELILTCSNAKKMSFLCDLSLNKSQEKNMIYHSNSELAQILNNYNVIANVEETIDILYNFTKNIKNLCTSNQLRGTSFQKQYYDLHTESINKMGIYSAVDMQNVLLKYSNNISWNQNEQLSYYIIDLDSNKEENDYNTFKLIFIYDYNEKIELTIGFSKKQNVLPSAKLT